MEHRSSENSISSTQLRLGGYSKYGNATQLFRVSWTWLESPSLGIQIGFRENKSPLPKVSVYISSKVGRVPPKYGLLNECLLSRGKLCKSWLCQTCAAFWGDIYLFMSHLCWFRTSIVSAEEVDKTTRRELVEASILLLTICESRVNAPHAFLHRIEPA